MSTKKGRWDVTVYEEGNTEEEGLHDKEDHGQLNLNIMPERHVLAKRPHNQMHDPPTKRNVAASRNAGKGTGRGGGRSKRPPAVQPRYHTSVSVLNPNCSHHRPASGLGSRSHRR